MSPKDEQRLEAFRVAVSRDDLDASEARRLLDAYAGPTGWSNTYGEFSGGSVYAEVKVRIVGDQVVRSSIDAWGDLKHGNDYLFVDAVKRFGYPPDTIEPTTEQRTTPPEIPDAPAAHREELPRKWQVPSASQFWQWLKARESETMIGIQSSIRRFAQESGYPDRWEDWDEHQCRTAHNLCIKLFRRNKVAIEPEPPPVLYPALKPASKSRILHINQAVAWLDEETGEEMSGIVVDQKHDGDMVTGYIIKRNDKSKVTMDAKMVWSTEDDAR